MKAEPKERGVLFNGDMVKALLDGTKTQTRRIMKVQPPSDKHTICTLIDSTDRDHKNHQGKHHWCIVDDLNIEHDQGIYFSSPLGKVGDVLYVRERARLIEFDSGGGVNGDFLYNGGHQLNAKGDFQYEADKSIIKGLAYPSRLSALRVGHCCSNGCFQELARIWLEITGVRVERIQDISMADAKAEGVSDKRFVNPIEVFWKAWDSCYPGSWERNDFVWVYDFERVE